MINSISFKVIKIKEYLISLFLFLFFVLLLLFSKSSFNAAKQGFELFTLNVLPSIFPFLVFSNILTNLHIFDILNKLCTPITKKLFNLPGISSVPIFLGFISGYPVGAKITNDLYEKGLLNKNYANSLLAFTNNSGPLFIISFIGISLYNDTKTGILLLITHILSAILVGIIFGIFDKRKKNIKLDNLEKAEPIILYDEKDSKNNKVGFVNIFVNSIKNSVNTILLIGGFVIFFSVIISLLSNSYFFEIISVPINSVLNLFNINTSATIPTMQGLIEITNGLKNLSELNHLPYIYKVSLSSFILAIGGLSIYMQLCAVIVDSNLSTKKYIIGKILQGIFAFILTFILVLYTPFFNLDSIETYTKPFVGVNTVISKNEINLLFDVITLCFIFCVLSKMYSLRKYKDK